MMQSHLISRRFHEKQWRKHVWKSKLKISSQGTEAVALGVRCVVTQVHMLQVVTRIRVLQVVTRVRVLQVVTRIRVLQVVTRIRVLQVVTRIRVLQVVTRIRVLPVVLAALGGARRRWRRRVSVCAQHRTGVIKDKA